MNKHIILGFVHEKTHEKYPPQKIFFVVEKIGANLLYKNIKFFKMS